MFNEGVDLKCIKCEQDFSFEHVPLQLSCGHSICKLCHNHREKRKRKVHCFKCDKSVQSNPTVNKLLLGLVVEVIPWICCSHKLLRTLLCKKCREHVCRRCILIRHRKPPRGVCIVVDFSEHIIGTVKIAAKKRLDEMIMIIDHSLVPEAEPYIEDCEEKKRFLESALRPDAVEEAINLTAKNLSKIGMFTAPKAAGGGCKMRRATK